MKLGEGFIEVRPDTDRFKRDLEQQTTGAAQSVSRRLGQVLAGGAFIAGAKKAVDAASDLNESINVTSITFGKAEDKVASFAKTAAESIGQSERAARSAAATFGGLLLNLGYTEDAAADTSIQLTKLASDLGSAFNTDPAEAALALSSALRGEAEPIQRYNVLLSDQAVRQEAVRLGLAKTTAAVDESGKVQGRLSLIMEQTSRVQGDFANTSEGAANAQRIAAAKAEDSAADLGQNVLPIYERAVAVVGDLADVFGSLPEFVQTGILALGGIAVVAGPVKSATEALGGLLTMARRSPEAFDKAAIGAFNLTGSLGRIASVAAGPAAGALGIFAIAMLDARRRTEELQAAAKELREEAKRTGDTLEEVAIKKLVEDFTGTTKTRQIMDDLGVSFRDLRPALQGTREEYEEWLNALNQDHPGDLRVETLGRRVSEARGALNEAKGATEAADEAVEELGIESEETAPKIDSVTDAVKEETDALNDLLEATLAQFDANLGYRQSLDDVEGSLKDLRTTQREHGLDSEEYRDALIDIEQAMLDQAEAAVRLYEDTAAANGETLNGKQRTEIYKQELIKLAEALAPGSELRRNIEAYIYTLGAIPSSIQTSISYSRPTVNPDVRGYAAGGDVMDGLFRVHEGEVMQKDGANLSVISGAPTALSGSTYFTTIYVTGTGESPAEALTRSARRIGEEVASRA